MGETAKIGYMPTRVWGTPTMAMWVCRLGAEKAKRMLFTGDKVDDRALHSENRDWFTFLVFPPKTTRL